jgi:hypothetical protein
MTPSLSEKDEQLNREIPSPAIIQIAAAGRNANQPNTSRAAFPGFGQKSEAHTSTETAGRQ